MDKFASYVRAYPFTLVTDCSTFTWFFKCQALRAKYHRWALRLMELDTMILEWRPGVQHQLADALSCATRVKPHGDDINDAFPGDNSTTGTDQLPIAPILDGVSLSVLASTREDDKGHVVASLAIAPVVSPAAFTAVALTPEVNDTSLNAAYYAAFDAYTRPPVSNQRPLRR